MNDRLYRSHDRILAGVAGGLAERLDLDATIVRLIWLLLVPLTGGTALIVYIVMAIIVPEDEAGYQAPNWAAWTPGQPPAPGPAAPGSAVPPTVAPPTTPMTRAEWRAQRHAQRAAWRHEHGTGLSAVIVGAILVLVGVLALVREYVPEFEPDRLWPFLLVGLGVLLVMLAVVRHPHDPRGQARPGAPGGSVR